MILVGNTVLQGQDGTAIHQIAADMSLKLKKSKKVEKDWKVLNVLHRVSQCILERFSNECRKTKTAVITLNNHNGTKHKINQSEIEANAIN